MNQSQHCEYSWDPPFLIKVESGRERVVFVGRDELNVNDTDKEMNSLILDSTSQIFRKF